MFDAGDNVKYCVFDVVTAPAPVILPVSVWFKTVDESNEIVPAEPIVIWPPYDEVTPSLPVTEIVPPDVLIVVSPE